MGVAELAGMGKLLLIVTVAALAVAFCDESTAKDYSTMSKDQLIAAVRASQQETSETKTSLESATAKINDLKKKLDDARHPERINEAARRAKEQHKKADAKKAEKAKRAEQLKKKEKLSDLLMEHGSNFLAMKTAKKMANKGSKKQKAATLESARSGGRAGAVGPLKKVVRAAAVAAVKKARAEAKKNKKSKSEIRKLTAEAAKTAVELLLKQQDELIEKTAQKSVKAALKKFPPSVFLAEHDDTPNNFVAPPSIHLSLEGVDDDAVNQVEKLQEDSAKNAGTKTNPSKEAKQTKEAKPSKEVKPEAAAQVAKAAAAAKQAAGKVVPENH